MMRLDKFLAHAGFGTRKEVKELVRKGRVEVNGQRVKKDDQKIDERQDQIQVDGRIVTYETEVYIMLNKPQGVVSATEDSLSLIHIFQLFPTSSKVSEYSDG